MAEAPAAIVLAGGTSRRMEGTDKLGLLLGGRTVLDRALAAAAEVGRPVVAVGPARPTAVPGVEFVREEPPGGGPVPAVQAGLARILQTGCPGVVLVLAGDLPLLTADALRRLVDGLREAPAAGVVAAAGAAGRPNPLLAAYRTEQLRRSGRRLAPGAAASGLLSGEVAVVDLGPVATLNVNTRGDLERAARELG